ncbi:MAG: hypothetical protein J7L54_01720 [Elusimicrobia bacterium]|nr:hypothetical protein [Elusimicrobiota bacterium]
MTEKKDNFYEDEDDVDFEEIGESETKEKLKEFYEKAKKFTRKVGEQISKQAEVQKLNLEIAGRKEELLRKYRLLGEKAFQYFKKNAPEDEAIKEIIGKIKKINSQIKALKKKIAEEKTKK